MEIQSRSEMSPYFTMTKCNKLFTSTECKTLKGERRMIFIFNIITALNYNQDRGIFCPCGKDALSL